MQLTILKQASINLPDVITGPAFSNYLVNIFLNMLFCTIILIVCFTIFQTYEKSKLYNTINSKFKYNKEMCSILAGLFISTLSLWYLYKKDLDWSFTLFLFACISFGFFYNMWFYFGFMPLTIIISIFLYFSPYHNQNISNIGSYQLILNAVLLLLAFTSSYFSKWTRWKNHITFLISNFAIIGLSIISTFPVVYAQAIEPLSQYQLLIFGVNYIFFIIISYITFSLFKVIHKFIISTANLSMNVSFKKGFILQKFANEQIKQFIVDNDISYGIVMKIEILGIEYMTTQYGSYYSSNIKDKAIQLLKSKLEKHNVLFYMQANDTEYFTFIKLNECPKESATLTKGNNRRFREPSDPLKFIEKILNETKTEMDLNINSKEVQVAGFCALYGIESNDMELINKTLNRCNKLNITTVNNVSYIKIDANANIVKKSKNDILSDYGVFTPNDVTIRLQPKEYQEEYLYTIHAVSIKPFLTTKYEIWNTSENKSIYASLMCHTSAKGIKEFISKKLDKDKNILLVDYPKYLLNQKDFNLYELNSNISSYGLPKDKFILNIYMDDLEITETFIDNIIAIKNTDIRISFDNIPKTIRKDTLKLLKRLSSDVLNLDSKKVSKKSNKY